MSAEARPREVSCLSLTFFLDYLAAHGAPDHRLLDNLPYARAALLDRTNWIDYATFLTIEERVQQYFPDDPDIYFRIGSSFPDTGGLGFLRVLVRSAFSPHSVYAQFPRLVPRFLFPFVTISFVQTGPGALHATYRFHDGYPPSNAFLDTVRGIITGVPTILGAAPAVVTMQRISPMEVHFAVRVSNWVSVWERMAAAVRRIPTFVRRRLRNLGDAATELEETNRTLNDKVDQLLVAKGALDARVRELDLLHAVGTATARSLDLTHVMRQAAAAVRERYPDAPVAILLAESEPPGLVIAAGHELPRPLERVLRGLAAANNVVTVSLLAGNAASAVSDEVDARLVPLQSRDRVVGALFVGAPLGDALLGALAGQLAVAVENARAFRTIADLRDNLEVRVGERTAELEEARTRLEDTVAQLEQADRAKAEFFTNVSHELRTPLTLILAPLDDVETALARFGDTTTVGSVHHIRRNARNLLRLVNEILDSAKFDAGRVAVERVAVDLAPMVEDVVVTLMPLADRKRIGLTCAIESAAVVAGDARLLRRVVVNLVSNALKYVDTGDAVRVRVCAGDAEVVIEVIDTGPGIAAEEQARVFERFQRARDAEGRRIEGTGIGLSMAAGIARAHGGVIELESELGRGSTFRVRLPLGSGADAIGSPPSDVMSDEERALLLEDRPLALAATVAPAPANPSARGGRVLLVEDNEEMREFLTRIIGAHHHVESVPDGLAVMAVLAGDLPDIVVSDVMMPGIDGYELCRRIKADPVSQSVPVILLSARHGAEAALQGFAAGADDYVVKPFSSPELLARIGAQIRLRQLAYAVMRMEKQTTLGLLAGGIAHEVLNPLNAVTNSLGPLRLGVERMSHGTATERDVVMAARLLDAIDLSAGRIQRIVNAILTFTRGEERPRQTAARLSEGIESILTIIAYRTAHVDIEREYRFDEPFLCYPEILDQVIMNLLVNAADAATETGSHIWIRTDRVGRDVIVSVRDDGHGVPLAIRERIFAPFFTTKAPGKGTGLGLAVSREIASLHGGTLELAAGAGPGAEFVLTLPNTLREVRVGTDDPVLETGTMPTGSSREIPP